MKKIFLSIFLFCIIFTKAQNNISGFIYNENNQNLENISVHLVETHAETKTNIQGFFEFKSVPKGKITLYVFGSGYHSQKLEITDLKSEIKIILIEKIEHLDEVILSTVFNKIQSQNVLKVEHSSVKSLKENGALTLVDGITALPGVSQIATGNSIGKPVIRGLSSNRILVYSQGVRLENQQFGEEHGLGLNASGIESVEVIKGPASLLYGSDAIGGVLYFNPEKYASHQETKADVEQQFFSNTQGVSTTFGYKTSPSNWKLLFRGNYTSHADYKNPNKESVVNTRFFEKDFKAGIGYANSKFSSDFRYNYNSLNLGLPEEGLENANFRTPLFPNQKVGNHLFSLNQKIFFEKSKIEADFGYSINDRKEFEEVNVAALDMQLKTLNYNVKYYLPNLKPNWENIIGLQGMTQTNENNGEEMLIPNADVTDFGTFYTTSIKHKSNILQMGIRYDYRKIVTQEHGEENEEGYFESISKNFNSLNASIGYKVDWNDKISSRFNIASGFRSPNLSELTSNGVHEGSFRYEIGNKNLKNEQNIQFDTNFEYKNEHFEAFANVFYNSIQNYIFISPSNEEIDDYPVYNFLQNNANLYGGEFGIHFHPHPLDWIHISSSFESVTGKLSDSSFLPLIPANQLKNTIRANYNLGKWVSKGSTSFNLNYTFEQNNISLFESKTNDYLLFNIANNVTVSIFKKDVQVSIIGNNILNKSYYNHLSRLKADGILNMGRNIILALTFEF